MRERTVFPTDELAHLWAHQAHDYGRCPSHMHFDGPTFYSYDTPIAAIRTLEDETQIYLVASDTYSISTTRHQSHVRRAIPNHATVFDVPGVRIGGSDFDSPNRIVGAWRDELARLLEDAANSRKPKNERLYLAARELCQKMSRFVSIFRSELNAENVKIPALPVDDLHLDQFAENAMLRENARDRKRRERWAAKRAEWDQRYAIARERAAENRQAWLDGKSNSTSWSPFFDTELRVVTRPGGSVVETSQGARVPLADAARLLRAADAYVHQLDEAPPVTEEQRQAITKAAMGNRYDLLRVGPYVVNSISKTGLVIGCHTILWAAINRIRDAVLSPVLSPAATPTSIRDTDAYKTMTAYHACECAEGFGDGENASEDERHAAWQYLVDTGQAWTLQGFYGRKAHAMLENGELEPAPTTT